MNNRVDRWTRRAVLQAGAIAAAAGTLAPRLFSEAIEGPGSKEQSWTLGNGIVERTIAFDPERGLSTRRIAHLGTRFSLLNDPLVKEHTGHEFSFQCDGKSCMGTSGDFELISADPANTAQVKSLTILLRHKIVPIEVTVVYRVYAGHAALRKHLIVRNTGRDAQQLSHMAIESLVASTGPADETTLMAQYGALPRETFYTGRSEDACLLVSNSETGDGAALMNEVPGYLKRTEVQDFYDPREMNIAIMYDTDLMPFERVLAPGEEFATADASLVLYRKNDAFNDPHWALPRYTAEILERTVDRGGPPWIFNTWEPLQRGINQEITIDMIEAAGAMGMDIFTIDDGWQQDYGENEVNHAAFSGGLAPILRAVEARGMRLGLWIPMAAIGTGTAVYRDHPDWAALDREGHPKFTGTAAGQKAVMCMASDFRESVAARVIDAIERFRLAYVKLDLTTIFNAYGEAPGCWAHNHLHSSWEESLVRIYEGIQYATARVYEKHPDVLLDLTFELWGQKHIIDAGLLTMGDLDWMSNVGDTSEDSAGPIQARQLLYQRAISMPAEAMLIGNLQADTQPIAERFATAIGSAPVLLGDIRKLSEEDRRWYHEKISWFKKLRKTHALSESFFPLGNWQQPTATKWDGFARFASTGAGIVVLFANESDAKEVVVQLPLLPKERYSLRSVMTGREVTPHGGADWTQGVAFSFESSQKVEIVEVSVS